MAKRRYKNVKLEQNELTSIPIGMFESRKKSSIGVFLILSIFILAVIFMPQITEFVNGYLNPKPTKPNVVEKPIKPNIPDSSGGSKDYFTNFSNNLSITTEDIVVSNFVVVDNNISYDVTNNTGKSINLEELNYYLEIYNSEQTFIERIKLADNYNVANGAFRRFERQITSSDIGYVSLPKKTIQDYPLVELKNSSDGVGSLVCILGNEKVTYKFREEKLKEITSEISYLKNDANYLSALGQNKIKVNDYNNKLGVSSTLFEYDGGFNITTNINLSEAERTMIFNADTFSLDTEPRVVKFEIEAQRFKCE